MPKRWAMGNVCERVTQCVLLAGCLTLGLGGACDAATIINGDFETPNPGNSGFINYPSPGSFGGWDVVGPASDVAVSLNSNPAFGGGFFPAQSGSQWVNLIGNDSSHNGAATGVQQSVLTDIGQSYVLSFWVGNNFQIFPEGTFSTSTVNVTINGSPIFTATNSTIVRRDTDQVPLQNLFWQQFSTTFQATTANTTIGFLNGDPAGDHINGLDNIAIGDAVASTPLPAALPLFATGLGVMGLFGWRRKRKGAAALAA